MISFFIDEAFYQSGQNGVITSPNYPGDYYRNTNYEWLVTVEPGKVIELTLDRVNLADGVQCKDFLNIYDGASKRDPLLHKYCGELITVTTEVLRSTGNKVYIHFSSDDANTEEGFRISWRAITVRAAKVPEGNSLANTIITKTYTI